MKRVLKVLLKIILELEIACICAVLAMFLMKNVRVGMEMLANAILMTQNLETEEESKTEKYVITETENLEEDPVIILDSTNNDIAEDTETVATEEPDIVIISNGENVYEEEVSEKGEIIELFTEKGTYFFE